MRECGGGPGACEARRLWGAHEEDAALKLGVERGVAVRPERDAVVGVDEGEERAARLYVGAVQAAEIDVPDEVQRDGATDKQELDEVRAVGDHRVVGARLGRAVIGDFNAAEVAHFLELPQRAPCRRRRARGRLQELRRGSAAHVNASGRRNLCS